MTDTHFHKSGSPEGQVSEQDILPDGQTVDVVPDWAAPEGTEVSYLSGSIFRRYKMIDGEWRVIGGANSGLQLITYQEASGIDTLTISDLDLNADKAYKIILLASSGVFNDSVNLRLNDDNSGVYNEAHTGYPGTDAFNTGKSEIWAAENVAFRQIQSEMLLTVFDSSGDYPPLIRINTLAVNSSGQPYVIDSSTRWNSGTNVTSIRFFTVLGNNFNWKIWVYKLATE